MSDVDSIAKLINVDQFMQTFGDRACKPYNIVITGPVAAGKSTVCRYISSFIESHMKLFTVKNYLEYLDYNEDLGAKILKMKLSGDVASLTLQSFVLDMWNVQLRENGFKDKLPNTINIFERMPEDSINCFCKAGYDNGELTEREYEVLMDKFLKISNEFGLFRYSKKIPYNIVENYSLDSTFREILEIILSDLSHGVANRVIILKIDLKTCLERVGVRGRANEASVATNIYQAYAQYYNDLVRMLMQDKIEATK